MCSLFSPLPSPDAASQGTKNFGTLSAERHEDCHCFFPFLEWGSFHVHPQREDASVSQQCSRCLQVCPAAHGFSPAPSAAAATQAGPAAESRGSPGGACSCLPWQGEGVGGHGATTQCWQGTCLHIPAGAGSPAADEGR